MKNQKLISMLAGIITLLQVSQVPVYAGHKKASKTPSAGTPIYGNYGGPGWSGGKDGKRPPCDVMDSAFMRHDAKYEQLQGLTGKLSEYQIARGFLLADEELINELNRIDPRNLIGSQCKIRLAGSFVAGDANQLRLKAIGYFQGQVTARKISVMRAWEKEARRVLAARR